jgi:sodium-dependent dicarboxylate transporter 2/3/5
MLGKKKTLLRRCMMLVIPACAGIGGFMTPAGTPANLLLLRLLEETGTPVTFLQWSLIGVPVGLLTAFLFTGSALLILRPTVKELTGSVGNETGSSPRRDALTAGIILLILGGWIASGWLPWLKLWHVACAGAMVMLLPGVRLLTLHALKSRINWDLVVTMATVGALMGAVSDSGLMVWIAQRLITPLSALPGWLLLPAISLAVCCIRAFIPTTTGAVTLLAPLLTGLAAAAGLPAHVLLMLLAFWTASAMLMVYTEPIFLLTWERKDYSALDLLRTGALPSLLMSMPGSFLLQALTLAVLGL